MAQSKSMVTFCANPVPVISRKQKPNTTVSISL
jgi:hypothetical protein